jgi:hypothetical protein
MINDRPPRHEHDCHRCDYLGRFKEYDLYICLRQQEYLDLSTVIARYGPQGEYRSGLCFCTRRPELNQALKRAHERGILKDPLEIYDVYRAMEHIEEEKSKNSLSYHQIMEEYAEAGIEPYLLNHRNSSYYDQSEELYRKERARRLKEKADNKLKNL